MHGDEAHVEGEIDPSDLYTNAALDGVEEDLLWLSDGNSRHHQTCCLDNQVECLQENVRKDEEVVAHDDTTRRTSLLLLVRLCLNLKAPPPTRKMLPECKWRWRR